MDWFYAEGSERRGPVTEAETKALVASGKITAQTLVWNSTFADWQAAGKTPLFGDAPPPLDGSAGAAVCIMTGKTFPTSQMIKTDHGWVSAEGRDRYYQSLREGVPVPTASHLTNAFSDGARVVIPVNDSRLPLRCVKTNQPVTEAELKQKKLYWCTPWVYLSLLASLIIVIILYYVLRKKVVVDIPLSRAGRSKLNKQRGIATGIAFLGLAMVFAPAFNQNLVWLIVVGLITLLIAALYGNYKGCLLRVVKLKDGHAWLYGADREFVDSLPPYAG